MPAPLDFFLMSNLHPRTTGLPFVVWIAVNDGSDDVHVKITPGPQARPDQFVSVAIGRDVKAIRGEMNESDLDLLRQWVRLNRDVILRYWNADIDTAEAIATLRSI